MRREEEEEEEKGGDSECCEAKQEQRATTRSGRLRWMDVIDEYLGKVDGMNEW